MQLGLCQHAPLHAHSDGAKRRKVMKALISLSGEKPQAPPAPTNLMHPSPLLNGLILQHLCNLAKAFTPALVKSCHQWQHWVVGSKTILLKRGSNAYTFTWVFLDKPVAKCFAQGICSLLNSQGAQAVTDMPFLVTMSGGLGSAASQPFCFPSSTCHLSSSHPIRCIYL